MACCVGIDWADRKHDVAVVDAGGQCQGAWEVPHTAAGLAQLVPRPSRLAADPRDVLIAIEQPHGLLAAGFTLSVVNPNAGDRYRDRWRESRSK